jgi:hypothetical protein
MSKEKSIEALLKTLTAEQRELIISHIEQQFIELLQDTIERFRQDIADAREFYRSTPR